MPQVVRVYQPLYVNTDADATKMQPNESTFLKNFRTDTHRNADNTNASGYGMQSGGNAKVGAPSLSNMQIGDMITRPAGFNKVIGAPEFELLNECYYFNYNDQGQHGIYLIDGDTMTVKTVVIDPILNFSLDPKHAIAEHRCALVVVYRDNNQEERDVLEKFLVFTDGHNWQRWINVNAAIRTDGFNVSKFPYWTVRAPHFDRAMMFDYATRPPMFCPQASLIPYNKATDFGKVNKLLNKAYQFAYRYVYTDGRKTSLSPYSNPVTTSYNVCDPANLNIGRCLKILLDAGGPMVEYIELYQRDNPIGEWVLYDTIRKYKQCGLNDPALIGTDYWLRQNPWIDYQYDYANNQVTYTWCGDRATTVVDQVELTQVQTGLPIKSVAMANLGDSILFADNLYGYPNWGCDTTDAFEFDLKKGDDAGGCDSEVVKISVYAYIGSDNRPRWRNQFAWSEGEWKDDGTQKTGFGLCNQKWVRKGSNGYTETQFSKEDAEHFGLSFNYREGPVCYLAGTSYFAIGKQWKINANVTDPADRGAYVGPIDVTDGGAITDAMNDVSTGAIYYFRFDFQVPKGKYIARLARHDVDMSTDYQKSSTYVAGIMDSRIRDEYAGPPNHYAFNFINFDKAKVTVYQEMVIDANQDVDRWRTDAGDMFAIFAPFEHHMEEPPYGLTDSSVWRFNEGHLFENSTNKIPVELMYYHSNAGDEVEKYMGTYTDHNGFYWAYTAKGHARAANCDFRGTMNCKFNTGLDLFSGDDGKNYSTGWPKGNLHRVGTTYITGSNNLTYQPWSRVTIKGKMVNCTTGQGVGNIAVTLTRGQTVYTNSDGEFSLYAHPIPYDNANTKGIRKDLLIYNGNQCDFKGCDCEILTPYNYDDSQTPCIAQQPRILELPSTLIKTKQTITAMLKLGGRYGIGAKGYDLAGRETFVQNLQYIDIPSIQENGGTTPVTINWSVPPNFKLPKGTKYISFYRTENLNFKRYVQWIGDKIEFINALGAVQDEPTGAMRARITIQSLLEFNMRENFSTTVTYQAQKGDIVRIIDDGEGNLLMPETNSGFMDYLVTGSNYIQSAETLLTEQSNDTEEPDPKWIYISYDSRLDQLKDKCSFWIEIRRDAELLTTDRYFEICGMYPVVNEQLYNDVTGGSLVTWDTYLQTRDIINTNCPGKKITHSYESPSVTDYWGLDYPSNGRINVEDKLAIQLWYGDDCIRSNLFVNEGRINGLGTFLSSNRKQFKGQKTGAIVAVRAETKVIVFVCENDWFMTSFDMNYVRNTAQGLVANNLNNQIDDNFQKVGDNNGCRLEDTAAIIFHDKLGWWPDANNRCVVKFNYQGVVKISDAFNKGYFDSKFTYMVRYNAGLTLDQYLNNCMELIAGFDPASNEYLLTFRKRNIGEQTRQDFVNLHREIRINDSETFVFSVLYDRWVRWMTFIPEFYGRLRKARDGKLILTFCESLIFAHNSYLVKSFNTFYGIKDNTVVEIVVTDADDKQLIYQSVYVDCTDVKWHADRIITNERNSYSYIPPSYFIKKEHVLYAEILRDMASFPSADDNTNGRLMLLDGKRIFGSFSQIRFVVGDEDADTYFEVERFRVKTTDSSPTPASK